MADTAGLTQVTMPQLGESVTEGQVSRWLKHPGDPVEKYEALVEIITDKVNAEVPSPVSGVMGEILVAEGDTVAVGTLICSIMVSDERADAPTPAASAAPATNGSQAGRAGRASPAVRRLADEHHLDIASIQGTGLGGRVTKKDVEDFMAAGAGAPTAVQQPSTSTSSQPAASAPIVDEGDELVPLNALRKAIAEHMVRSRQTAPHAWCATEVDMSGVVALRDAEREAFRAREGVDLSYVPFAIKAACEGLRAHPGVNATFTPDGVLRRKAINISVAVSLDDGLILPVIHDADKLSLAGLAHQLHDVAERARAGRLTLEDVQRGTFCVNNPGTFGTVISAPIINQPQAAIMTMEAIVKRPVVLAGDLIGIRSMMFLGMSFDHRVMDGMEAASFLGDVKRALEAMAPGTAIY
jgi:2-oxoisovalerate dehydrogenase E2 component (dihydrolipoyl transacylase)